MRAELKYRNLFATNPESNALKDPHLMLLPIYEKEQLSLFQYGMYGKSVVEQGDILFPKPTKEKSNKMSVIPSFEEFQQNFECFSDGLLEDLNFDNILIAGGAVLSCIQPTCNVKNLGTRDEMKNPFASSHDIDIFLYGLSIEQANKKVIEISKTIYSNIKGFKWSQSMLGIRSGHAITFVTGYLCRHIQIITRIYSSPAEILLGFDVDVCCIGYNGSQCFALPRALRALNLGYNLVDVSRRSLSYEARLFKYAKRGYSVKVSGFIRNEVDPSVYDEPLKSMNSFNESTGLRRLLLLEAMHEEKQIKGNMLPYTQSWRSQLLLCNATKTTFISRSRGRRHTTVHEFLYPCLEILKTDTVSTYDYIGSHIPFGESPHRLNKMLNRKQYGQLGGGRDMRNFWRKLYKLPSEVDDKPTDDDPMHGFDIPSLVEGLDWVIDNPGRQIIGSFHPIPAYDWAVGVPVIENKEYCKVTLESLTDNDSDLFFDAVTQCFNLPKPSRPTFFLIAGLIIRSAATREQVQQFQRQIEGSNIVCKYEYYQVPKSSDSMQNLLEKTKSMPCNYCKAELLVPKRCSACRKVQYCGKACQIADWRKGHKYTCSRAFSTRKTK